MTVNSLCTTETGMGCDAVQTHRAFLFFPIKIPGQDFRFPASDFFLMTKHTIVGRYAAGVKT